jgi:hypothetical protein
MGKKSRRKAKLRAAARMGQSAQAQPMNQPKPIAAQLASKPVAEVRTAVAALQQTALPSQANRYQYVPAELRQIAIIAGILFVILFVLALILH